MKKVTAMILAFILVFSLSTTAFAETMSATGSKTLDVTASYNPAADPGTIYNVDINWDSMSFNYTETSASTWQPSSHTYSTAQGKWEKTTAGITVTNHSEAAVQVDVTYASALENSGITGTITNGSATLKAGVVGKPDDAAKMTATLTISGTPNSSTVTKAGVKIGTITIKIA